jgi:hypothetical protein
VEDARELHCASAYHPSGFLHYITSYTAIRYLPRSPCQNSIKLQTNLASRTRKGPLFGTLLPRFPAYPPSAPSMPVPEVLRHGGARSGGLDQRFRRCSLRWPIREGWLVGGGNWETAFMVCGAVGPAQAKVVFTSRANVGSCYNSTRLGALCMLCSKERVVLLCHPLKGSLVKT